jgi:hypothetical protein
VLISGELLESDLHLAMKEATIRDICKDSKYWTEYMFGWRGLGGLRVDVNFTRNRREHLVECETRPNMKRLIEKGKRRNKIRYRTVYMLVVPFKWYKKQDWTQLIGYFDIILAYDVGEDAFAERMDLRFLGSLRDTILDIIVPIYRSEAAQSIYWKIVVRKNRIQSAVRTLIQCTTCKLDIETPWIFCSKYDCPDSVYDDY